jgi:hypothetical protein
VKLINLQNVRTATTGRCGLTSTPERNRMFDSPRGSHETPAMTYYGGRFFILISTAKMLDSVVKVRGGDGCRPLPYSWKLKRKHDEQTVTDGCFTNNKLIAAYKLTLLFSVSGARIALTTNPTKITWERKPNRRKEPNELKQGSWTSLPCLLRPNL